MLSLISVGWCASLVREGCTNEVSVFKEILSIQGVKWVRLQKEEKVSPDRITAYSCWLTNAGVLGGWQQKMSSDMWPSVRETELERDGEVSRETFFAETLSVQLKQDCLLLNKRVVYSLNLDMVRTNLLSMPTCPLLFPVLNLTCSSAVTWANRFFQHSFCSVVNIQSSTRLSALITLL